MNRMYERVVIFENLVQMNCLVKKQAAECAARNCIVQRLKFEGPADPMEIPPPPEDGSEPLPIDEERKAAEF